MSYDKTTGVITAPVSISDVQAVLGDSSSNLSALCKSSKLNRWSRFKPIAYNAVAPDRTNTKWAKGTNGHCGFLYGQVTAVSNVKSLYSLTNNGWTPEDIPNKYYRLMDFNHYWHYAKPPISGFTCTEKVSSTGYIHAGCSFNIQMPTDDVEDPGSVNFSDIGVYYNGELVDISKMYFGIIVYDGDTLKGIRTSDAAGTFDLSVLSSSFSMVKGKSYTVYPVYSSVPYTSYKDIDEAGCYISLPEVSPATCTCTDAATAAGLSMVVTAKYNYLTTTDGSASTPTGITVTIKLTSTGSSISLSKNYIQYRFTTSNESDALLSGETQTDLGDITVTTTTKTITKTFTTGFNANKTYHVIVSLQGGVYKKDIAPMQQMITAV